MHLHLFLTDPLCTTAKGSARQKTARSTTKTTASAAGSTASKNTTKTKAKGAVYIAS